MKELKNLMRLMVVLFASITLWGCGGSDPDPIPEPEPEPLPSPLPEPEATKLVVDVAELNFSEKEGDVLNLNITSNADWSIKGKPEWVDLSSASGSSNATIKLTTNSFNNSSSVREATLTITAKEITKNVKLTQKAGLVANCAVKLNRIVCLNDAVAFDFSYEDAVSYFYVGYLDKDDAGRMTDDEIIEVLDEEFERYTPSDGYVISFPNLTSMHNYIVYTVAYDKNGKRGELIGKEVRTKSGVNQPVAYIENVKYDSSKWYFDTVIGAYSSKYYIWLLTGATSTAYSSKVDAIVAWQFAYNIDKYPSSFEPALQSSSWKLNRNSDERYIQIVTWGVGADGEFGGVITNGKYKITSSSAVPQKENVSSRNADSKKVIAVKIEDIFKDVKVQRVK